MTRGEDKLFRKLKLRQCKDDLKMETSSGGSSFVCNFLFRYSGANSYFNKMCVCCNSPAILAIKEKRWPPEDNKNFGQDKFKEKTLLKQILIDNLGGVCLILLRFCLYRFTVYVLQRSGLKRVFPRLQRVYEITYFRAEMFTTFIFT